jgi:hypothetical protein
MLNVKSPLYIRLNKWVIGAFLATLFVTFPAITPKLIPSAFAGPTPAADLDTIASYLRNYQGTDLRNPGFYSYTLGQISGATGDRYDVANGQFTEQVTASEISGKMFFVIPFLGTVLGWVGL